MSKIRRLAKSLFQLLLPVIILIAIAAILSSVFLNYMVAKPPVAEYLVTPETFAQLSSRGAQITDENWSGSDGTEMRGWLLRGATGAPAVVLLHKYGADRSYELSLGVKLNETTNFTILMPDLRAHGQNATAEDTTFSGLEIEDIKKAIKFLRSARSEDGNPLVGEKMGIYGIELGAIVALGVAKDDPTIEALVLDSVPSSSDEILENAIRTRYSFGSSLTSYHATWGTYLYYFNGDYRRVKACDDASTSENRKVMLLSGPGAGSLETSTSNLANCFPKSTKVTASTDLSPSGYNLLGATLQQIESYDNRVIYFLKENLEATN